MAHQEQIEAFWDCGYCNKKGILGRYKECPSCGHPRGANTKFYLTKDSQKVTNETRESFGKDQDWVCSFCDCSNKSTETTCQFCGADRTDGTQYFEAKAREEQRQPKRKPQTPPNNNRSNTYNTPNRVQQPVRTSGKKSINPLLLVGVIGMLLAIVGCVFLFANKQKDATLVDKTWERIINLEQNTLCHESDWSKPADAFNVTQSQEIHHYDKVEDHREQVPVEKTRQVQVGTHEEPDGPPVDNGNGTFTQNYKDVPDYETETYTVMEEKIYYKDVPVYQTKYNYDIYRWLPIEPVVASGSYKDEIKWPTAPTNEEIREAGRTENYKVTFQYKSGKKDKKITDQVEPNIWQTLQVDQSYRIHFNVNGINEIEGVTQ